MSDIFEQATQPTTPASQGDDSLSTKLAEIKNEKGEPKYANVEVALDALKNSQDYIPSLKGELATKEAEISQLRLQMAEQQGMSSAQQEMVRLMQTQQQQTAQPTTTIEPQSAPTGDTVDVNSLVQAAFQAHQQQTKAESNLEEVNRVLASQYGDKAVEHLSNKARELNTSPESLQEMAKTNPAMALTLLGVETSKPVVSPTYGGTNTAAWPAPKAEPLTAPSKSLLVGAKKGELESFMKAIQAEVYREHGITG